MVHTRRKNYYSTNRFIMSESTEIILPQWKNHNNHRRRRKYSIIFLIYETILLSCIISSYSSSSSSSSYLFSYAYAKPLNDNATFINSARDRPIKCRCLGNGVDCSKLQLLDAPNDLPPWVDNLDLSINKLRDDVGSALAGLTQLRTLKLNKNQLTTLPYFSSLPSLTELSISRNLVTTIDGNALMSIPQLQSLDLSRNRIPVLSNRSFLTPNNLTYLNLNMNEIGSIENGSLDNLRSLRELRLNKNRLEDLGDHFANLEELRILELNRNELSEILFQNFKKSVHLEQLRLKRNKIRTLADGAFWPLQNLVVLQLDYNMLSVVKKGGLFGLNKLHQLTISHNKIRTIESQAWEICKEITELDLSHNELTLIERGTFESLDKLKHLKLDHNKINSISDGAFNDTPNLRILELNENKISYMVEDINGAFASLINLEKLGLARNRIKSINKNAFIGLRKLRELDLAGNEITTIQENALLSMKSLKILKMDSGALLCNCGLQWLGAWLRSRNYSEMNLSCGYPQGLQGTPLTLLHQANSTCNEYPIPIIVGNPKSQMSTRGDNVTLYCRANSTANAPLRFAWKHDNTELKNFDVQVDKDSQERGVTEALSSLHLINVTHADAGKYQCTVSNTYGTSYSTKAKISVLVYPTFTKVPHDVRVNAGSTAKLECAAEGQPTPQIAWQKDGGNDFPAARERRMHMMPTDDVLFILNFKAADTGVYSCTAQNLAGTRVANASLTILETPSFVKPMENKEIIAGGSIVLGCMASGSPRPKLTWSKNGSPLQTTERHFFTAEDQLLIIVDTIPSDAGSYECEMSNSYGKAVGASLLTIKPAPTPMVNKADMMASTPMMNKADMMGIIIITVVCCAVGTSVVWVVIIYQTRRRLSINHSNQSQKQNNPSSAPVSNDPAQTHLYSDTSSQHSKDSGTGDSTNPSSDQLQLCLPEEMVTCSKNNEEIGNVCGSDPLLGYTNHERLEDTSESVNHDATSLDVTNYD